MDRERARTRLSVVVVSFNGTPLLERCLQALSDQHGVDGVEILVVRHRHGDDGDVAPPVAGQFPGVTWLHARDAAIPHMRRLGVAESGGDVVALIEDDCVVGAGWAAAIMRAHEESHVAVGGAVEPGAYRSGLDWAAYFCDYARFMLPFIRGETAVLPGNNVSYKRTVVPELLAMTADDGLQEAFVHTKWHGAGKPMLADPRIVVHNEHRWKLCDVTSVPFFHGRGFGGRRARDWGRGRRTVFALGTMALPLVHVSRTVQRVLRRKRAVVPLLTALPWIGVFGLTWAAGECVGYVVGPGDSLRHWR